MVLAHVHGAIRVLVALLAVVALAACDSGGSSSDSGSSSSARRPDPTPGPVTAELAWGEASGPVAGYRVWESRNGGSFQQAGDVADNRVTVAGEPGDTLQVQVAALDAMGNQGPRSDPSQSLHFEDGFVTLAAPSAQGVASTDPQGGGEEAGVVSALGAPPAGDGASDGPASIADAPAEAAADAGAVRLDMSGDGSTDLLWESVDGSLLRVTDSEGALVATFDRPAAAWSLVALADLDGDGLGDLLWARDDGSLAISRMALSLAGQPLLDQVAAGSLGDGEQIQATGDSDGDGVAELIVQDSETGALAVWNLSAGADPVVAPLGLAPAFGQVVAGSRDYDGDDRDDLLLEGADGALTVWLLDSLGIRALKQLGGGPGGEVLASGDFDGDGIADVARRDAGGGVELLLLGAGLEQPVVVADLAPAAGLERAGAGDYDGDGRCDLLWRDAQGDLVVWYLDPGPVVEMLGLVGDATWSLLADWR